MVDLYRDIDWASTILEYRAEYPNFLDILKEECKKEQESPEFKAGDWRIPVPNTSFSNYVILLGAPTVKEGELQKIKMLFLNKVLPTFGLKDSLVR
jgi:hypothetical protein